MDAGPDRQSKQAISIGFCDEMAVAGAYSTFASKRDILHG
jgi:hypothetical protein